MINRYGAAVIAGSAAAAKVVNLATAIPINYSNAYSNYVGRDCRRCRRTADTSMQYDDKKQI